MTKKHCDEADISAVPLTNTLPADNMITTAAFAQTNHILEILIKSYCNMEVRHDIT